MLKLLTAIWYETKIPPKGIRYRIRGMTYGEFIESQDLIATHREAGGETAERIKTRLPKDVVDHSLRSCVLDWDKNQIGDAEGKPLNYSPELIERIHYGHAMELCREIGRLSQLAADTEKNSSSQSKSRPSGSATTAKAAAGAATATRKTRRHRRTTSP